MGNLRTLLAAGTALSALVWCSAAAADAANEPAASRPGSQVTGIAEVVVTAQRRSENLQNVPIAVATVSGASLQQHGIRSTEELASAIPSLTVFATAGFSQPRIRGIGNNVVGAGYEGGVSTYVDGVYIASAPASLFTLNNVERVEVLKGPQGTLFGRNATGGLIQIITRAPSETPGGTLSLTTATYRTFTADGYLTGRLAPGLAADFAAHVTTQGDGYGTNLVTGKDVNRIDRDVNLRASLLYNPTADTKIRLIADYEHTVGSNAGATRLAPGTGAPFPAIDPGKAWNIAEDIQPFNALTAGGVSLNAEQNIGFANLVSISAYRRSRYEVRFDGDVTSTPAVGIDVHTRDRQFTQELQLTSLASSRIKWVVGAFYLDADARYDPSRGQLFGPLRPITPLGPLTTADTFAQLPTKSIAGYAQATAPVFDDATNLTIGARYTSETHEISANTTSIFASGLVAPGAPIPSQSKDFTKPTWRISLDHRFSPELMAYVSYNRGFKSGGYNGQFPTDPAFLPEKLDAYEIGVKSDLWERRLRINAAAFYYDYSDIQVAKFIGNQTSYYNGAAARVYGFDADVEARLTSSLTLTGGLTLLHDRFEEFPNAVISTQVPTGIIVTTGSAKGNRLPLTPDVSGTIAADYRADVGFAELGLDASYNYSDGYFTQPDNILKQKAYSLVSAGAQLTFPNKLNVRVWGRNLANAKVGTTLAAGSFDSNVAYQAPRTFGVTVGAKF